MNIEMIDEVVEELYALAASPQHRRTLDDAIAFFEYSGISEPRGILEWVVFDGGVIESFIPTPAQSEAYEALKQSFQSVFMVMPTHVVDLITEVSYPIQVKGHQMISGRLVHEEYILPDYEVLDGLPKDLVQRIVRNSNELALDLIKLQQVATNAVDQEEPKLYQATFEYIETWEQSLQDEGYTISVEESGAFSMVKDDRVIAEVECGEKTLVVLCNNESDFEQVVERVSDISRLLHQEVLTIEDLL